MLAHNPTISALAGDSGSRRLQDIIVTENLVLQSLQTLSKDFGRSTDALRKWAGGEGEDLEDTFSACATLLNHWVSSLASFASHIVRIRKCLKAIRTREEALGGMRHTRQSLVSKADSTDKRFNKMSSGDRNVQQQKSLLVSLREQIRTLDVRIMNEEASFSDWKRTMAREWMGVLFGGLLECCEKGTVVATFGRAIVGHVSTERTQPGLPRAPYSSHSQVGPLVMAAERELRKIAFVSEVGDVTLQPPNELRIGDTPRSLPSPPISPIGPTPTHRLAQKLAAAERETIPTAEFAKHLQAADDTGGIDMNDKGKGKVVVAASSSGPPAFDQDEPPFEYLSNPNTYSYSACNICFEPFQVTHSPISAVLAANSSTRLPFGLLLPCPGRHPYCIACLAGYIKSKLDPNGAGDMSTHAHVVFPIRCPECPIADWETGIQDDVAEKVLDRDSMSVWYHRKLLDSLPRQYCPNPKCSVLVQIDEESNDPRARCPACFQWVCIPCRAMWHTDMNCKQFKSLPLDERSPEDRLAIDLVKSKKWCRCPGCRAIVERRKGCNHMTCLCKMEFCFKCGSSWGGGGCTSQPSCDTWNERKLQDGRRGVRRDEKILLDELQWTRRGERTLPDGPQGTRRGERMPLDELQGTQRGERMLLDELQGPRPGPRARRVANAIARPALW